MKIICAVPQAAVSTLNAQLYAAFPNLGSDTFSAPLSSDSAFPATHYLCSLRLELEGRTAFLAWFASNYPAINMLDYIDVSDIQNKLTTWNLKHCIDQNIDPTE